MTFDTRPGIKRRAVACIYLVAAPLPLLLMSPESPLALDIAVNLIAFALAVHGWRLLERDRRIEDAEWWAREETSSPKR